MLVSPSPCTRHFTYRWAHWEEGRTASDKVTLLWSGPGRRLLGWLAKRTL